MPGIAGLVSQRPPDECQRYVNAMIASMHYEKFYASGTCFIPELGIYGGWVAHQDSYAASQFALDDKNEVMLLFSGECFQSSRSTGPSCSNTPEHSDRGISQLLTLYARFGDRFCEHVNGLFSCLLIDRRRRKAWLVNDRYGAERIYYYEKAGTTFFASEAKALLRILPELRTFDDEGVSQFLTFGCTLKGRTLYRNLRFQPSGAVWTFDNKVCSRKQLYFRKEEWEYGSILDSGAFEAEFRETFRRVLPRYLSADSSIGLSLTGGLDTRMIMACIPEENPKPICYTFSGVTDETVDARLAADVADVCGFEHHVLRLGADFFQNFGHYVDRTVFATDGRVGAVGSHEIYLNALARNSSVIRLTGNFGGEILRGVSTFKPFHLASELIEADFRTSLADAVKSFSDELPGSVSFAAFKEIPWKLFGIVSAANSQVTVRTVYLDNELVELAFRAPPTSRQSPGVFLRFVDGANPQLSKIPTDQGLLMGEYSVFNMMRRLAYRVSCKLDYFRDEGVPDSFSIGAPVIDYVCQHRRKNVHKYLPYRRWFQRELSSYVSEVLNDPSTREMPFWNAKFLRSAFESHVCGRSNLSKEIHAVITLEAIERMFFRNPENLDGV